jgi:RNA polymerase sigma-70 factor (ECF subfamily)
MLERCKANDPAAWVRLFRGCAPRVHRWAVLLGLRANEAEDAVQEVLATVARRIDSCESEHVLISWIYQITRRVVANARRGQWLRRMLPIGDGREPAFDHDDSAEAVEFDLTVRACLRALPLRQAEVLVLSEIEGFSRREISELLGVAEGTVASRMRLAKRAFQNHWARLMGSVVEAKLAWER